MDKMDQLLSHLNAGKDLSGLAERIRSNFHRRRQRRQRIRLAVSAAMVAAGFWLFLPWLLYTAGQITLPQDGISMLQSLSLTLSSGSVMTGAVENAAWVQSSVSSSIGLSHGIGLMILMVGAFLGLDSLLPGRAA